MYSITPHTNQKIIYNILLGLWLFLIIYLKYVVILYPNFYLQTHILCYYM